VNITTGGAIMNNIRRFIRDSRGASLTEYIILIGIVALIAYGGFRVFGQAVTTEITNQASSLDNVNTSLGGGNH
jgi:Flp pilus assembly pilin Flp